MSFISSFSFQTLYFFKHFSKKVFSPLPLWNYQGQDLFLHLLLRRGHCHRILAVVGNPFFNVILTTQWSTPWQPESMSSDDNGWTYCREYVFLKDINLGKSSISMTTGWVSLCGWKILFVPIRFQCQTYPVVSESLKYAWMWYIQFRTVCVFFLKQLYTRPFLRTGCSQVASLFENFWEPFKVTMFQSDFTLYVGFSLPNCWVRNKLNKSMVLQRLPIHSIFHFAPWMLQLRSPKSGDIIYSVVKHINNFELLGREGAKSY